MAEQQTIVEETIADNSSETDKPACKLDLDTKPNMTNNYPPFSLQEEAAIILMNFLPDDDPFD